MSVYHREGVGWYIDLQIEGVRIARKAGDSEAEAIYLQNKLRQEAKANHLNSKRNILFDKAAQDYLRHIKATLSARSYELALTDYNKYLKLFFELTFINEIDNSILLKFQARQKGAKFKGRKLANRTVNIHMGLIRKIRNHAIEKGLLPDTTLHFPMLREAKRVHAYLSPDEFKGLASHVSYALALARIEFGRYTGMRPKELAYLAWTDISMEAKTVKVQSKPQDGFQIKTDEERVIPLNSEAVKLLQSLRHVSKWIFSDNCNPILNIRRALKTAAIKAGIKRPVTPGMLRHTFASHLLMKGVDIETLRQLMGHQSITTTQRYLHTAKDTLKNAVELL